MSEGSQNGNANADAEKNKDENLDANKLKATADRLLKESQEWKARAKALEQEKADLELKKLEESGDTKAQLEAERKKAAKALEELKNTQKKVISQTVKEKVAKYAGEVHNIDDLLARPKFKDYMKLGLDKDSLDFNDDIAKQFVEETKKEAPYLWKAGGELGVNTHRARSTGTGGGVDTSKMGPRELKEYIKTHFK